MNNKSNEGYVFSSHKEYDRKPYLKVLSDDELDVLEALSKKAIIESRKLSSTEDKNKSNIKPT